MPMRRPGYLSIKQLRSHTLLKTNADRMKAALVFVLLFASVLCRPAKYSASSEESSEEAAPILPQTRIAAVVQSIVAAASISDESAESAEPQAVTDAPTDFADATTASDTASVDSADSEDSEDEEDEDDSDETEEDEDESSNSSESGEFSTPSPVTIEPVVVTEEPATEEPITATIILDPGRGDSLGSYYDDYKTIIYVEEKSYDKMPAPYKSYEFVGEGKKTAYYMSDGNEVEKTPKAYKALQVHNDLLEEDTSTPEVESQGLDTSSQDQELSARQASLPAEEEEGEEEGESEAASTSAATTSESDSASAPEEEEESASEEQSQSSEEEAATATPGAADSQSDESAESEELDASTDMPAVISAK